PDYVATTWTDWLYAHHTAQPTWHIWVGRYDGAEPIYYNAHDVRVEPLPGSPRPRPEEAASLRHGVLTTLIVGYLAVQVFGMDGATHFPASTPPTLQEVWPALGVVLWPPKDQYDDTTLNAFAERVLGNKP